MIHKHEGGQSLTATVHELGFAVSTVKTVVKDAARINEYVNFIFYLAHVRLSVSTTFRVYY